MRTRYGWPRLQAGLIAGTAVVLLADAPAGARTPVDGAPPADAVVSAALATARAQHKAVLIEFGASWCPWCRNFQAFVHAPATAPVMADNYVIVTLTVHERDADKTALENPGGAEAMVRWGGANAGLPFYVFLDAAGHKLADSNVMPDGANIGYPVSSIEIARFVGLIDRTAPRLTSAGRTALVEYLRAAGAQ